MHLWKQTLLTPATRLAQPGVNTKPKTDWTDYCNKVSKMHHPKTPETLRKHSSTTALPRAPLTIATHNEKQLK